MSTITLELESARDTLEDALASETVRSPAACLEAAYRLGWALHRLARPDYQAIWNACEDYANGIDLINDEGRLWGKDGDDLIEWRKTALMHLIADRLADYGCWREAEAPEPWHWNAARLAGWLAKAERWRFTPQIRQLLSEPEPPTVSELVTALIALEGAQ